MRIDQLAIGTGFRIPCLGKTGTLLTLGPGSATVEYDSQRVADFVDRWGERVTFVRPKERVAISRATEVEPVN